MPGPRVGFDMEDLEAGNSSSSRELSFGHFSTIKTIDVNSVPYADGSTWRASSPGAFSVAPGLIMRIVLNDPCEVNASVAAAVSLRVISAGPALVVLLWSSYSGPCPLISPRG